MIKAILQSLLITLEIYRILFDISIILEISLRKKNNKFTY